MALAPVHDESANPHHSGTAAQRGAARSVPGPADGPPSAAGRPWGPRLSLILAVAGCVAVAAMLVPRDQHPEWDEIVYISQIGVDQVPMWWGGHRAWGTVLLVAPVVLWTKSIVIVRWYLLFLAAITMAAAFWPWLGAFARRARYTAPLAASLFGTGWLSLYYASHAYPNLWLAFALIGGTGCFVRAVQTSDRRAPLVGTLLWFTAASLLRPTDAVAAAIPLLATVLVRRWHTRRAAVATASGLGVGLLVWTVEAFIRFGGPIDRLQGSSGLANTGVRLRLYDHLVAADGPYTLCMNLKLCQGVSPGVAAWWIALPLLALLGTAVAWRVGARAVLVPFSCAVMFAAPYFVIVGGAHPRFLSSWYGLLAVPVAFLLLTVLRPSTSLRGWLAAGLCITVLLVQAVVQLDALRGVLAVEVHNANVRRAQSDALVHRGHLRAPCLVYGHYAVSLEYEAGCDRIQTRTPPKPGDPHIQDALDHGARVALVYPAGTRLPQPYAGWHRIQLIPRPETYAYLSPG